MSSEKLLKILVIGSAGCGKSTLANFLTDQNDLTKVPYYPTKGVRILETDSKHLLQESDQRLAKNIVVQLWDCGGDMQNQQNWNAFLYNADGAVIVYDADRSGQDKDLETILYFFNQRPESAILKQIPESRLLVTALHHKSLSRSKFAHTSRLPSWMNGKAKEFHATISDNSNTIRQEFGEFITRVYYESVKK